MIWYVLSRPAGMADWHIRNRCHTREDAERLVAGWQTIEPQTDFKVSEDEP